MRPLILILAACSSLWAVPDFPNCYINNAPTVTGAGSDSIRVQVRNNGTPGTSYTVNIYIDDPTMTSLTDFKAGTNTSTVAINIPNAAWTDSTGTINAKDGAHHKFYAKIIDSVSFPLPTGVPCISGNGMQYTWNIAGGVIDYLYPLYTSVTQAGATPLNTAVIVNVSDTYSLGSAGSTIYTVGGTAVKSDGVVGYYGNKYGIPSAHIHKLTMATAGTITAANMATAFATLTPALGSDEQYIALGWMTPFNISGLVATGDAGTATASTVLMSVTSYFAYGGPTSFTSITSTVPSLVQGQADTANCMFLSTTTTPFTDCGQRPAFQLGYGACTASCSSALTGTWTATFANATAAIDASYAANRTNPLSGKIIMTSSANATLGANYFNSSTRGYGTNTISPTNLGIVTSTTAVATTFSTTGITGYSFSASGVDTAATPAFQSGVGYWQATASFTGQLNGASGQTQAVYGPNIGAAFACGSVVEPYGFVAQRYPDFFTLMSGYTRGMTAIEAAWHSMRDPAATVCVGDPLSQPFTPNAASGSSGASGPITISGPVAIK